MPSVYRRGGVFHCAYTHFDGVRRAESTGYRVKKRALAYALKREDLHARLRNREISWQEFNRQTQGPVPMDGLVDEFTMSIRPGTWRRDGENIVNKFIDERKIRDASLFGEIGICTEASEWLKTIPKGLTNQRRNDYIRTLKRFGKMLWRKGLINTNELNRLESVKRDREARRIVHRALTPVEAERLFVAHHGLRWRFTVWTGLRNATVGRLTREHLEFTEQGALLRIPSELTKNQVGWVLPLAPGVAERMDGMSMRLFPVMRRELLRKRFQRDAKAAELAGVNLRSLRKTHTTWLTAAGIDSQTIGTLRLDIGEGSQALQRGNYSEPEQLVPRLREALVTAEGWYSKELSKRKAVG